MVRIAGYLFEGRPVFNAGYNRRGIGFVVPLDTSNAIIEDLKNATSLEVLDRNNIITATYRLCEWNSIERIFTNGHSGIAITWVTVTLDETDQLKQEIAELRETNESLLSENSLLTDALLELADIVGNEE